MIDISPINGNLLASCSPAGYIRIFDRRSPKTLETFVVNPKIYTLAEINSVRWSPNGKMLAAASANSVTLLDFPSGKPVSSHSTSSEFGKLSLFNYIIL